MSSTRYGLSLKLDMDNAAFEEDRAAEVARILRCLAERLEDGRDGFCSALNNRQSISSYLWDVNGNSCGAWKAKPRRIRD